MRERMGVAGQMKVLVIEDEPKTAAYLKKGLTENGFVVDVPSDGQTGLHQALDNAYDVIVCDVMLPRVDGWSSFRGCAKGRWPFLVILLTARDAVPDRVKGLELGADDYLVKPFAFSELLARIRNVVSGHDAAARGSSGRNPPLVSGSTRRASDESCGPDSSVWLRASRTRSRSRASCEITYAR